MIENRGSYRRQIVDTIWVSVAIVAIIAGLHYLFAGI